MQIVGPNGVFDIRLIRMFWLCSGILWWYRWFAKRFMHPDVVAAYEYVFLWDEDLGVDYFDPIRCVLSCTFTAWNVSLGWIIICNYVNELTLCRNVCKNIFIVGMCRLLKRRGFKSPSQHLMVTNQRCIIRSQLVEGEEKFTGYCYIYYWYSTVSLWLPDVHLYLGCLLVACESSW